ncbi:hypothetical protein D3C77_467140 [compost metagenome]
MGLDGHRQDARKRAQQRIGVVTAEGAAQAQRRHLARCHAQGLGAVTRDFFDHFTQRCVIEYQFALAPGGECGSVHGIGRRDVALGIDLRAEPGGKQCLALAIVALHLDRALLYRHPCPGRIQAHIETGASDCDRAIAGTDDKRPRRVMGNTEHDFTRRQFDAPLPGAEVDRELSTAIELQLRAIR